MLTAVSLFAGVGGIDLTLERAGISVVAAVEIDKAARGVIRDRFPHMTLFDDVTEVTGDQLRDAGFVPRRGIVAAGWPCQGNSVAGRRQGMDDARSGLWVHVARLLAELHPAWFLGENVPGLLSVNDGNDMAAVLADLADVGMGFAWRVLDAQHFGVPQRRRRVFIVGRTGDWAAPVQILLEPESSAGDSAPRGEAGTGVAGTLGSRAGGSRTTDLDGHGAYIPVSTLQGGGHRGHRVDAESAARGYLIPFDTTQITSSENRSNPQLGDPCHPLAAGAHAPAIAHSLMSHGGNDKHDPSMMTYGTHALTAEGADASEDGTRRGTPLVGFHLTQDPISGDVIPAMGAKSTGNGVMDATAVRRLTPLECERLQGFPDRWTATSYGKPQADSARYRQLGNAVAVPVAEWVARRIAHHHQGTAA